MAHRRGDGVIGLFVLFSASLQAASISSLSPITPDESRVRIGFFKRFVGATGDVETQSLDVALWNLDLIAPIGRPFWDESRGRLGVGLQIPYNGIGRTSVKSTREFVPLRYAASDSDFGASVALSKSMFDEALTLSLGHRFFVAAAATAEALIGENPSGSMELATGPVGAWFGEIRLAHYPHSIAIEYRDKLASHIVQKMDAGIEVSGVVLNRPVSLSATTRWEPESAVIQYRFQPSRFFGAGLGLGWENWRAYETPFLKIDASVDDGQPVLKNTLSPKAQITLGWGASRTTLEYNYLPSPLVEPSPLQPASLFDNNTHRIVFRSEFLLSSDATIGLLVSRDFWQTRRLSAASSSEVSHFTVGGGAWLVGSTLSLSL